MNSSVPSESTAAADLVVTSPNPATLPTDEALPKRCGSVLRRIAAVISAAHTARVPF